MSQLIPFVEIEKMAHAMTVGGFFGYTRPEEALSLMLIAQAEGRHPASIAADYHIIKGRPALKADAMLSRFQLSGGSVEWREYSDAGVVGIFSHPQGGSIEVQWDVDRAKQAGLWRENFQKYPRAMFRARCISEAVRTVFPACLGGFYTPEEVEFFEPAKPATPPRKKYTPKEEPKEEVKEVKEVEVVVVQEEPKEEPKVSKTETTKKGADAFLDAVLEKKIVEAQTVKELGAIFGGLTADQQDLYRSIFSGKRKEIEAQKGGK